MPCMLLLLAQTNDHLLVPFLFILASHMYIYRIPTLNLLATDSKSVRNSDAQGEQTNKNQACLKSLPLRHSSICGLTTPACVANISPRA